jgi:hypothetical protein
MKTTALLLCALAPFVAGSVVAGEPRGVQTYEFATESDAYIPCLDEVVRFNITIEVRTHVFSTKTGTVHLLDNWTYGGFATGLSTGREWLNRGVSPFQSNTKVDGSGVTQSIINQRFDPVAKGDTAFYRHDTFKITVNANGELVVERLFAPGVEEFRCKQDKN